MSGPGEYRADCTEGITRVEDLPRPLQVKRSRNYSRRPCPRCGRSCYRDQTVERTLHDLGDWRLSGCATSSSRTRNTTAASAMPTSMWTCRTWHFPRATTRTGSSRWPCVWSWRTDCLIVQPVGTFGGTTVSSCRLPRSRTGWRPGKKAEQRIRGEYLHAALDDFSGYIAADELYDGPFCVLSIVDNRTFRRLVYEVLDHDPDHTDIERLFRTFQTAIQSRNLVLQGITTDASALYPEPIFRVFGDVPHQLCEFHAIKELTKAVLHAGAKIRKELAATKPALGRGRPSSVAVARRRRSASGSRRRSGTCFSTAICSCSTSLLQPSGAPWSVSLGPGRIADPSRRHGRSLPPLRPSLS